MLESVGGDHNSPRCGQNLPYGGQNLPHGGQNLPHGDQNLPHPLEISSILGCLSYLTACLLRPLSLCSLKNKDYCFFVIQNEKQR